MLSVLCRILLWMSGWDISTESLAKLRSIDRGVIVFPHTSKWDSLIGMLVIKSFLMDRNPHIPMYYKYMGEEGSLKYEFFRQNGIFPVCGNDTPGGAVQSISDTLNSKDKFLLIISPEGQCKKAERLRTGCWRIAKNTGATLTVANMDYHNKRFYVGPTWLPTTMESDLNYIERCFALHAPYFPEETHYATHHIKPYDSIEWDRILIIILIFAFVKIYVDLMHKNIFEDYRPVVRCFLVKQS